MRKVKETVLSSSFTPFNLNSLLSVYLQSSGLEQLEDPLVCLPQEPTESFLLLESTSIGRFSDFEASTSLGKRSGTRTGFQTARSLQPRRFR